jgi:hypothetical protein
VLRSRHIDMTLRGSASPEGQGTEDTGSPAPITMQLPWTPTCVLARKGIVWKPSAQANLDPAMSNILLTAIARARSWMNDLTEGRVKSFEEIARSENKVERHIRRLIPLAFVSPRIVEAIANGSAPADLTVTSLTSARPAVEMSPTGPPRRPCRPPAARSAIHPTRVAPVALMFDISQIPARGPHDSAILSR